MVFIENNSLKSDILLIPYLFHVFQDSCFSWSRFFRAQVFQGPGPGFRSSQFSSTHTFELLVFYYGNITKGIPSLFLLVKFFLHT